MMKQSKVYIYDQIASNKRLSVILTILVIISLIGLIYYIGYLLDPNLTFIFFPIAVIIALSSTIYGYYNGDKIVLKAVNGVRANPVKHRQVYDLLEGVCIGAGMKMPDLYLINSPDINAFATGRDPEHSIIGITTGAVNKLDKLELEGVIAHELSHIKNYDIKFMTLVSVLIGSAIIISELFRRSIYYGTGRSRNRDDKGSGIILIIGILFAILTPILMRLIQLAISRKREYLADASGALITRYPDGLADALEKIKVENKDRLRVSKAVMHLFIANPLKRLSGESLFSTHPPIDDRINRLRAM